MNNSKVYSNNKQITLYKKHEHISPYFMISSSFPQIVYKMMRENPIALLILFSLMDCSNNNGAAIITEKHLAKALQISSTSVYKAIRYLNQSGYIKILDYGGHNLYVINANLFWHTYSSVRNNIVQDMAFKSVAQLTRKSNHKAYAKHTQLLKGKRQTEQTFQQMHKNLLAYKNNNVENALTIRECIKDHRRNLLPSKYVKEISKNQGVAKRKIKQIINRKLNPQSLNPNRNTHLTNKELIVIRYVLRNTPAMPDQNMRMLVKGSRHPKKYTCRVTNKKLASLLNVSYKIVANTLYKLRKIHVIDRKHGRIFFNPMLVPMVKDKPDLNKMTNDLNKTDKIASPNPYSKNKGSKNN